MLISFINYHLIYLIFNLPFNLFFITQDFLINYQLYFILYSYNYLFNLIYIDLKFNLILIL
jgi:hypothetical protein